MQYYPSDVLTPQAGRQGRGPSCMARVAVPPALPTTATAAAADADTETDKRDFMLTTHLLYTP